MNTTITSAPPVESEFAPARAKALPEPPVHLARLLLGLIVAVAAFDACFWRADAQPGLSVAVFCTVLAGVILCNRARSAGRRSSGWLVALLGGAIVAATIETGVTNTFVLLALVVALAGETYFLAADTSWGRWLSQCVALVFAPGRVFWLAARLIEAGTKGGLGWTSGVIGAGLLAVPALLLALVFGSLLATGNAVFSSWAGSVFNWTWQELALYLDPFRIIMWLLAAFVLLPLLRPAQISPIWWKWTQSLPRFPEILPARGAIASSAMVLVVLNLLFLVSNVADALFLWSGQKLPADVSYQAYVHEGVNALIATVILSAVVLTVIFQQAVTVVRRRELKALAYFWIAQNIFLISTVAEKLWGFIVTYEMTVARLSTIIFLIMVFVGFILLTIKIAQDRSISWLIGGCVLAVFGTFYITQFLDLAGWSANYNVARMEQDPARVFDTNTMCRWGPDVWPALRRAHELAPDNTLITVSWQGASHSPDYFLRSHFDWQHWREFSLRAYLNRWAVEEKPNN